MTYLLAVTLCAITGPAAADCTTVSGYLRADRASCEELRQPMQDHVLAEAEAAGMRVVYLATQCKPGLGA